MPHMHDIPARLTIALQHGADIGAGFRDVGDGEEAVVVLVLRVDDDVDAVGGRGLGGGDGEEGAEGCGGLVGGHCFCFCC